MDADSIRRLTLALPEATDAPHFEMCLFHVRGKIFVSLTLERKRAHVFLSQDQRDQARARAAGCRTHLLGRQDLYWGGKICDVRVALRPGTEAAVSELINAAWRAKALNRCEARLRG